VSSGLEPLPVAAFLHENYPHPHFVADYCTQVPAAAWPGVGARAVQSPQPHLSIAIRQPLPPHILPPSLHISPCRYRRPPTPYDPEQILVSSGLEPLPVAAFLHENYPHFVAEVR
jgi:hypothetical protein